MPDMQYLGIVKKAPYGVGYRFATVEPLVESDPEGSAWVGRVEDAVSRFPKRGYVHWHDAPADLRAGSLWQFAIDELPTSAKADRSEHFQLQEPKEPFEVIDLRAWGDELSLRSAFTSEGLPLSVPPIARSVLIWVPSGGLVGPLLLKQGNSQSLWVVDRPLAHADPSRMPVWAVDEANIGRVHLDRARLLLAPSFEFSRAAAIENWASDLQVSRSILNRLRKMDPEVVKGLGVTDNVFREYLSRIDDARFGSFDPAIERARAERLRMIRETVQRDVTLLKEAAQSLAAIDPIQSEIQHVVDSETKVRLEERRAAIDSDLSGAMKELATLKALVAAKTAELSVLDTALKENREELESAVSTYESAVEEKLREVARRPESFFAEVMTIRAALGVTRQPASFPRPSNQNQSPANEPAPNLFDLPASELLKESDVRQALGRQAVAHGLSIHGMLALHASFLTGLPPVVVGHRSYDLLRAYAAATAGGRLQWIPVGSSMLDSQDLLGSFDASQGRIRPASTGLLEIVRRARESGRLYLVVLEGFNRAPTEGYLWPILASAKASRVGDGARVVPLASPEALSTDDPYRELSVVAWPLNVLIACIPTEGTTALPVPSAVLSSMSLVDSDDFERQELIPAATHDAVISEISPQLWRSAVLQHDALRAATVGLFPKLADGLSLRGAVADEAFKLREALCSLGLPVPEAEALAIASVMLPRVTGDPKAIEQLLTTSNVSVPNWRTVRAAAEKLRQ